MLFDTVYKFDLHSIKSNIRVNQDWNRKKNIAAANTEIVAELMVQPTFNPNIYREIVTGILIPVYRTTLKRGITHSIKGDTYYKVPKKPVFIKIKEINSYSEYTNDLVIAKAEEVKKYIEKHTSNVDDFKNKLNNIFQTAEEYYENASSQNNYSNKVMVKSLLKSLKKK